MRLTFLILSGICSSTASAQPTIAPNVLGYAYDAGARAIRVVRGVPGAALISGTLDPGVEPSFASVSPSGAYALTVAASGGVSLLRSNGTLTAVPVDPALIAPDAIIFSPAGAAAVVYSRGTARAQLVTGLPDSPAVRDLPPAGSSAVAVADNGTFAIGTDRGARIITPDQTAYSVPFPAPPAVLAFDSTGARLLAVSAAGKLYIANRLDAGLDVAEVPSDVSQTIEPVSAQFAAGASSVIVATARGAVAIIDIGSGSTRVLDCQCAPTALQPFGRAGLYRLTDVSDRPLMLFDAAAPNGPKLWFVPAVEAIRENIGGRYPAHRGAR